MLPSGLPQRALGDPSQYPRDLHSWLTRIIPGNRSIQITPEQLDAQGAANGSWMKVSNGGVIFVPAPAVAESDLSLSDVTTANASTSRHGLLPKLDGSTAHFFRGDGVFATPPDSGSEVGYDQITGTVNIVGTTLANSTTVIAGSVYTYDGAPVVAEFFASPIELPAVAGGVMSIVLFEGGTSIATIASFKNTTAAADWLGGVFRLRFTPSAGSHAYSIKAWVSSTTGTPAILGGSGTGGAVAPAYLRFTKV